MYNPDPDWYEAHDEEETYVAAEVYGTRADQLAQSDYMVISRHAQLMAPDATFQALIWDTVTIWLQSDGRLTHYQEPPLQEREVA